MSNNDHDNFTVDEEVILYVDRRYVRGKVTKVTKARVTVVHGENRTEVFHRRKWGPPFECRRVTAKDIAREAHEANLRAWEAARPPLEKLKLRRFYSDGDLFVSLPSEPAATPDTMRAISDEAEAIREWLRKRPEEPRS